MKRPILVLAAVAIIGFLAWRFLSTAENPATSAPLGTAPTQSKMPQALGPADGENSKSKIPAPSTTPDVPDPAKALNSPATDIRADLRLVSEVIEAYRTNFLQTGNPTGSNAEITAALAGKNKLRFAFIAPNHPAINRAGELCDRWGTPFFFHSESATKMEIRSAGPDKKMWTEDDVVLTP